MRDLTNDCQNDMVERIFEQVDAQFVASLHWFASRRPDQLARQRDRYVCVRQMSSSNGMPLPLDDAMLAVISFDEYAGVDLTFQTRAVTVACLRVISKPHFQARETLAH